MKKSGLLAFIFLLMILANLSFISALWNSSLDTDLLYYYNFTSKEETIFGENNLSDYQGSPTFVPDGKIGGGANLSTGNNFNITSSDLHFNIRKPFTTINLWIRPDSFENYIMTGEEEGTLTLRSYLNGGTAVGGMEESSLCSDNANFPASIVIGEWMMITLNHFNETGFRLFINGALNYTCTINQDTSVIQLYLGKRRGTGNDFEGTFDELGIWNRSLSLDQISTLYNSGTGLSYEPPSLPSANTSILIDLLSPINNYVSNSNNVTFNCSGYSETPMRRLDLILDNKINYTITNSTSYENLSLEFTINNIANGTHTWNCQGYNGISETNGTQKNLIMNLTIPEPPPIPINITIVYPLSQTYTTAPTHLDYLLVGLPNLCEYSIDNGITNNSITCGNNATGLSILEGNYTWWVNAFNITYYNINSSSDYYCTPFMDDCSHGIDADLTTNSDLNIDGDFMIINYTLTNYVSGNVLYSFYHKTQSYSYYNVTCINASNNDILLFDFANQSFGSNTINRTILPSECVLTNIVRIKISNGASSGVVFAVDNTFDYQSQEIDFDSVSFTYQQAPIPTPTATPSTTIYSIFESTGAGIGMLMIFLSQSLPILLLIFIIIGSVGMIIYAIFRFLAPKIAT